MNTDKSSRENRSTKRTPTGIVGAALANDLQTISRIIDIWPEAVNEQDSCGLSALMAASGRGHIRIVKLLASHPDILWHLMDDTGRTALDYAYFHLDVLQYLVKLQFGEINLLKPEAI